MKTLIRDDKGNEESVQSGKGGIIYIMVVTIILGYFTSDIFIPMFGLIAVCFSILLWERVTFDEGTKSVIIEKGMLVYKENKKIRFLDIAMINIEKYNDSMGGKGWGTNLSTIGGDSQMIFAGNDFESAKEFVTKLCKMIGVKGYYIDENKKSTPLIEAT